MRIVTKEEMRDIEKFALEKYHYNEKLIVENVGKSGAEYLCEELLKNTYINDILVLCGKGNNGSDGLAIARHLTQYDKNVRAFVLFPKEDCQRELLEQLEMARAFGVKVSWIHDFEQLVAFFSENQNSTLVIDAIFGTGVQLPLSQFHYDVINFVNQNAEAIVSIDMPSGVEGNTGLIQGNAIDADVTLAVGLPKIGYYLGDGARLCGTVVTINAGLPKELLVNGDKHLLNIDDVLEKVKKRDKFADKKVFGHTLVIGGSHGLTGALVMASQSALRVGSGLVTGATWENQYNEFITRLIPEVMTGYIPMEQKMWGRLLKEINKYDAIVIGPGLGRSARSRNLVLEILNNFSGPLVMDADAINVLSMKEDAKVFSLRNAPTVLTPHFGEFCRFTGVAYEELQKNPVHHLKQCMETIHCSIILKGPCTYIGLSSGQIYFNYSPNDGMATGGVGDVLAGILGGLLGQDPSIKRNGSLFNAYEHFDKTVALSVIIHSLAGKIAAENLGVRPMIATSIIDNLPLVFKEIDNRLEQINA
ncbi:MAG: NAD(P)H-hydrate dehydratase [Bacteriovoracaceae bacterium]|nr:NAD(P)H-hydrate dehydratase [Bacteriovoracaceae bacterium]